MKVTIIGAGIGGMALAALLRQRNITCELYERAPSFDHSGYMLGLYPVGTRVLHGLGLMDDFIRTREPFTTYTIHNGHGTPIHSYELGAMLDQHGYSGGLMRGELIRLLRSRCEDVPLHFNTRLTDLSQSPQNVHAAFSNGTTTTCDLLVGADGIHSTTRALTFDPASDHDTGWGCWVWIIRNSNRIPDAVAEYWGASRLIGVYPVKNGFGIVGAGPTKEIGPDALQNDGRKLRQHLAHFGPGVADLLSEIPDDLTQLFWWKLSDYRSPHWTKGRVTLLGDAACAFLPTAGVGASVALESSAVLADELTRTDSRFLPSALDHYEKRRKTRAQAFQDDSRRLASMMMTNSTPAAWTRDQLMKFYTLEMLAKNIVKTLSDPI